MVRHKPAWTVQPAMRVIVAGPDERDIAAAIEAEGHEVARVDVANRPALLLPADLTVS